VRQVGLLTIRLTIAGEMMLLNDDGPDVGSSIPEDVVSVLPDQGEGRAFLLLISSTCTPCRELVADLQGEHRFQQKIVALVPGPEEVARELAALLPSGMQAVLDPQASELAEALDLESTPFALQIEDRTVTRKAFLHEGASALIEFVESAGERAETKGFVDVAQKEAIEGR